MKPLARNENLIAICGTAILTGALYYGVYRSGGIVKGQIQREMAETQARIDNIPDLLSQRAILKTRLDVERQRATDCNERVPTKSHVGEVLHSVASLAQQSGLTITRLEPFPSIEFNSYAAHPFQLGCRGTFDDISEFLSGLETQSRLMTFGDVELATSSEDKTGDSSPVTIHANLHFNVYSRHAKSTRIAGNTISRESLSSDN